MNWVPPGVDVSQVGAILISCLGAPDELLFERQHQQEAVAAVHDNPGTQAPPKLVSGAIGVKKLHARAQGRSL